MAGQTTPVANGTDIGDLIGGKLYGRNLINDTAGADAMGLVHATPAPLTLLGRLKAITDALLGATPAGENYIGKTGGDVVTIAQALTVTIGTYATGNVIGAEIALPAAARIAAGAGVVQSVTLHSKTAQTAAVDLLLFISDPTTTFTDKTALALLAADFDKLVGVVHLTDWTNLGTPSIAQAHGLGIPFKLPAGTSLWAIPVARGAMTFAAVTDLTLVVRILPG